MATHGVQDGAVVVDSESDFCWRDTLNFNRIVNEDQIYFSTKLLFFFCQICLNIKYVYDSIFFPFHHLMKIQPSNRPFYVFNFMRGIYIFTVVASPLWRKKNDFLGPT